MVPFIGFMVTVGKLNGIQSTVDIHNDIHTSPRIIENVCCRWHTG